MRTFTAAAALLLLIGCSNTFKSPELGFEMDVPKGHYPPVVKGKTADFGGGLEIVRVDEQMPAPGSIPNDEIVKRALENAPHFVLQTITSRREGTIGDAKVLRFEFKDGPSRGLVYLVPRGTHYFVLSASSAASDASTRLDRIERAFGTLKLRD